VRVDFQAIVTGVLALIILIDVSLLIITGRPIPELLSNLTFGVFGYYFGRNVRGNGGRPSGKPD
jgi:hypothetical protein